MTRNEKVTDVLIELAEELSKRKLKQHSVIDLVVVEKWLSRIKTANR